MALHARATGTYRTNFEAEVAGLSDEALVEKLVELSHKTFSHDVFVLCKRAAEVITTRNEYELEMVANYEKQLANLLTIITHREEEIIALSKQLRDVQMRPGR